MIYTDISQRKIYNGTIHSFSGELDDKCSIHNLLREEGFWSSKKHHSMERDFFIVDFGEELPFNFIDLQPCRAGELFPESFRIETSRDGETWKPLHFEKSFDAAILPVFRLDTPLMFFRYLKVFVIKHRKDANGRFCSEIGRLTAGIWGPAELEASATLSSEHDIAKILDRDRLTWWESAHGQAGSRETVSIDLGAIFHINRISLSSAFLPIHGFPDHFVIEVSTDRSIWTTVVEESGFAAESSRNYFWDVPATPARYVQFTMQGVRLEDGGYGVRLAGLEISAAHLNPYHTHNIGDITPYASVFGAGIVRLAKDGEDSFGAAVQGSDHRLRDASTIFKGIVQLANDGEYREGFAVQASDSRIQPASEVAPGIVRLAYDREDKGGAAVQANDSRLREATVESYGITRLCPDGIYSENSVVVGNDSRLKKATSKDAGIVRFAEDGETSPECAVQGNDRRLRDATILYKGIVRLAEDGEATDGVAVQGSDRRLRDATTIAKGIVELAEDGENRAGVAVQGSDRRLRDATTAAKGIVELAEDGEEKEGLAVQANDRRLRDATTDAKGIVELAEDGEDRANVAVQGNDRRLKNATELASGIMRFAKDGETSSSCAVQGSDRRLRDATTAYRGIVELAEDGESTAGVAVQGNDRRLKDATTDAKGIVELAEDGEDRPGVAVQGNDRRLKDATEERKGILRFAHDNETSPGAAVQGNDRRLKEATTTAKGIVELAEDGEDRAGVAVQGSDRRLKEATTTAKGIVELAEDGEDRAGVAVQGSDRRLKNATETSYGIVRLAADSESKKGCAVQANDARLFDKREPLPHTHEYAHVRHEFNSHTGSLHIAESSSERFSGIVCPPDKTGIIYGKNDSREPGSAGIVGATPFAGERLPHQYGVIGHSQFVGVRGQSAGHEGGDNRGSGVLGISRFGAGGAFVSEHSWSLVADGFGGISEFDDSARLIGNGDALLVNGRSSFNGRIHIATKEKGNSYPSNIVEMFVVDEQEFVSVGDLLVAGEGGGSVLSRSRTKYNRGVIGIVSGNPSVILDNSGQEQKLYPVVLAGKALCKVDARSRPISPGDLIVSSDTPGCGMAGDMDSFQKIGTVIAKALDSLAEGIGTIPVFIFHA